MPFLPWIEVVVGVVLRWTLAKAGRLTSRRLKYEAAMHVPMRPLGCAATVTASAAIARHLSAGVPSGFLVAAQAILYLSNLHVNGSDRSLCRNLSPIHFCSQEV